MSFQDLNLSPSRRLDPVHHTGHRLPQARTKRTTMIFQWTRQQMRRPAQVDGSSGYSATANSPPLESCHLMIQTNNKLALEQVAELIVINMPDRTDKRDRMTLMGSSTGLRFTFLPGVDAAKVPDSAMPPEATGWTGKVRGSWRAHMDALRYIVQHNIRSAIIFEDDLDSDVRIRQQTRDFALASRALLQPLAGRTKFADPTYPTVKEQDAALDPPPLNFTSCPGHKTRPPRRMVTPGTCSGWATVVSSSPQVTSRTNGQRPLVGQ
jgi:hypothetical protein